MSLLYIKAIKRTRIGNNISLVNYPTFTIIKRFMSGKKPGPLKHLIDRGISQISALYYMMLKTSMYIKGRNLNIGKSIIIICITCALYLQYNIAFCVEDDIIVSEGLNNFFARANQARLEIIKDIIINTNDVENLWLLVENVNELVDATKSTLDSCIEVNYSENSITDQITSSWSNRLLLTVILTTTMVLCVYYYQPLMEYLFEASIDHLQRGILNVIDLHANDYDFISELYDLLIEQGFIEEASCLLLLSVLKRPYFLLCVKSRTASFSKRKKTSNTIPNTFYLFENFFYTSAIVDAYTFQYIVKYMQCPEHLFFTDDVLRTDQVQKSLLTTAPISLMSLMEFKEAFFSIMPATSMDKIFEYKKYSELKPIFCNIS